MKTIQYVAQIITENEVKIPKGSVNSSTVSTILRLVSGVAGAVAVLVITIAGIQYIISQGNPQATAKAKDTILYALIGLVVCIMAFSIVTFVIGRV